MNLHTNVRNFTGRTLTGLEVKGMVVDHQGQAGKPENRCCYSNQSARIGT